MKSKELETPAVLLFLIAVNVSCGGSQPAGESSAGNAGSGGAVDGLSACAGQSEIVITDETNYAFSNSMQVRTSTLKDASDLSFDWSGVTTDFFGHPIDAAEDIDLVLLSLWSLTPEGIEEALKTDELSLSLNAGALTTYPDGSYTSENLLDFNLFGEEVADEDVWAWFDTSLPDYAFPQDQYTFLVTLSEGTQAGKNARMLHMFTVDPNASETTLVLGDDSTVLTYSVDLESARAVELPSGDAALEVDWGDMTETALGTEYQPFSVNEAVVAHYSMTRASLEANFLSLEDLADGWWSSDDIAGTSVELGALQASDGSSFSGITDDGLWLLALFCRANCNNPAPVSITFLKPCP